MVLRVELPTDLSLYVWKLAQRVQQLEHQLQLLGPVPGAPKVKVEIDTDNPVEDPLTKKKDELNFDDLVFHQLYNDTFEGIYGPQPKPKSDIKPDLPHRPTFDPPAKQSCMTNKPSEFHPLRICPICRVILPADAKDKTMEFFTHQTKSHFFYALDKSATENETRCRLNDCRDQFSTRYELILHMGATHGLSKFIMDRLKEAMTPYGGVENNGYKCFVDECTESSQRFTIGQLMMHLGNVHFSTEILEELAKYQKYQNLQNTQQCPIDFCSVKCDKENDMMNHFGIEHCAVWGIAKKACTSTRSKEMAESLGKIALAFSEALGTSLTSCRKETNGQKCTQVSSSKKWHIYHLMTIHGNLTKFEREEELEDDCKSTRSSSWSYQCPIDSKHKFNKNNEEKRSTSALLGHLCSPEHFEPEFEKTLEDKYPNCPFSDKCKCNKFLMVSEMKQHMKIRHPDFLLDLFKRKFADFKLESCLHEEITAKDPTESKDFTSQIKANKSKGKTSKSKKKPPSQETPDRLFELYKEYCAKKDLNVHVVNIQQLNIFLNQIHSDENATVAEMETLLGMFDAMHPGTSKNRTIIRTIRSFNESCSNDFEETPKAKRPSSPPPYERSAKDIKSEIEVSDDLPGDDMPDLPLV